MWAGDIRSWYEKAAVLPMLLPTITYGFAIIYSFGNAGAADEAVRETDCLISMDLTGFCWAM